MDARTAKQLLEEEQERLRALQRGFSETSPDRAQADNGSAVFENEKERSIRHQVVDDLRDVADALARLDAGRYGHCETCSEPIPVECLAAVPATRFCAEHESMWEADRLHLEVPAGAYGDDDAHAAERAAAREAGRNLELVVGDDEADEVEPGPEQRALHLTDPTRAHPDALTADQLAVLERRRAEWTDEDERVATDAAREEEQ